MVLDKDVLVFDRAAALVLYLRAEAVDVRDRDLERLLVRVRSGPVALIEFGIDRHIRGLGRNAQAGGLVVGRQDAHHVGHDSAPLTRKSRQTRPDRPAARLQLMSISDFSFAGSGLICISMVCFMTNTPILAMF